ncbi:MAG: ATP-binding protein [Acidovorax sp.]
MEHFSIVHAICRMALASPNEALTYQVERLSEALAAQGDTKSAQQLTLLLRSAARSKEMAPRRLVPSKAEPGLPGETLLPTTILPTDRESGARLVETVFPTGSDVQRPFFPVHLERAIQMLLDEWRHVPALVAVGEAPTMTCLLTGAPGTGKTTLALWLAHEIGLPVLVARVDAMMSSFLGTTSRNIAQVFAFANRFRCVLLLDELDSLAKVRDDPNEVGEIKRVVNALLQNMDTRSGITLGITNHPQLLDPAVWRRFAAQIEVPLPSQEARELIVRRTLEPLDIPNAVVVLIAAVLEGSAGSEARSISTLFKKRSVMNDPPVAAVEVLREIATLNSGRLSVEVKAIFKRDDAELARWIRKTLGSRISLVELGGLFDKSKSTVGRWLDEQD